MVCKERPAGQHQGDQRAALLVTIDACDASVEPIHLRRWCRPYEGRMRTLSLDAQSYLEAGGLHLTRAEPGFLAFERPERDGSSRTVLIWTDDETRSPSSDLTSAQQAQRDAAEAALLARFSEEMDKAPGAIGCYLVASRLGYSQHFLTEATRILGDAGGIRVPVEFFDAAYRIERKEARRARSVLGGVLALAEHVRRVPQPFSIRESLSGSGRSKPNVDLVEYLKTAIREPGPKLRILDGAAGSGKTIAFNALTSAIYQEFITAKRARHARVRPVVFLPEHLRGRRIGYVDDIIAVVAETDIAELTTPEQFKWLLKNGHAIWMFDGLDEFYAGDSDFFSFVEDALSAPDSNAQFVICTRDLLLGSSPAFRAFLERQIAAGHTTEIYELSPWTAEAWRKLAWLELEGGREEAMNSPRVERFVATLERSPEIAALAQLPFYCSVMLSHFHENGDMPHDELDVLDLLVESMVRREHGKRLFQWQDFVDVEALAQSLEDEAIRLEVPVPNGDELEAAVCRLLDEQAPELLFELIGGLAHRLRRTPRAADGSAEISVDDARDLIAIGRTGNNRDEEVLRRLRVALVRFAFFGAGRKSGAVDFTHEILADYFAARYAVSMIARALRAHQDVMATESMTSSGLSALRNAVKGAIGIVEVAPASLFQRYFARELGRDPHLRSCLELVLARGDLDDANVIRFLELLLRVERPDRAQPPPLPSMPHHAAEASASRIS